MWWAAGHRRTSIFGGTEGCTPLAGPHPFGCAMRWVTHRFSGRCLPSRQGTAQRTARAAFCTRWAHTVATKIKRRARWLDALLRHAGRQRARLANYPAARARTYLFTRPAAGLLRALVGGPNYKLKVALAPAQQAPAAINFEPTADRPARWLRGVVAAGRGRQRVGRAFAAGPG